MVKTRHNADPDAELNDHDEDLVGLRKRRNHYENLPNVIVNGDIQENEYRDEDVHSRRRRRGRLRRKTDSGDESAGESARPVRGGGGGVALGLTRKDESGEESGEESRRTRRGRPREGTKAESGEESGADGSRITRRCTARGVSKGADSGDDSDDDDDDDGYHGRSRRHTSSGDKRRKSVRISVVPPPSSRRSPRRTALKKPKRYLDTDDEAPRVYPLRNRLSSLTSISDVDGTPSKALDTDIEEMTYENLARGAFGRPRRRVSTPLPAPPASRTGDRLRRRHGPYSHRQARSRDSGYERGARSRDGAYGDGRSRGDEYDDGRSRGHGDEEPRRSGRQRKLLYDTFNQSLIAMMNNSEEHRAEESNKDDSMETPSEAVDVPPRKKRRREVDPMPEEEMEDMYARVKRPRRQVKRDMYGIPVTEEEKSDGDEEGVGEEGEDSETEEEAPKGRSYSLREHRPRPQMLEINWGDGKRKKDFAGAFRESTPPPRRKKKPDPAIYRSPARRKTTYRRRKAAFHGSSSTSSSSGSGGDSSDDERRFDRRKAKSMAKSRQRCLPMNLNAEDVATGVLRDRAKIGASLADIDPMNIDRSVTFDSVGGMGKHIRALKEMIVFPLLYPEVFERFKIQPPRGVLFYGPPGTGKTLVARALANECSTGEKKVAFFMRKGADCLSKWVGESERQLRLLFDQAYQMRPSIIFFDEIDGLAPVRSSRQDQIHSSIVSTLLALMDGLDNRGEIVVIGATNRLDSIDPALRRPGRFDREFLFPLPSVEARKQILQIHTSAWSPKLAEPFLAELAEKCTGYCGADLKALCTEAALQALRRRYPQIYTSQDKLQLDVSSISVSARDFHRGMLGLVPAAQRAVSTPARALPPALRPLLRNALETTLRALRKMFPTVVAQLASVDVPGPSDSTGAGGQEDLASDSDEDGPDIFLSASHHHHHHHKPPSRGGRKKSESGVAGDAAVAPAAQRSGAPRPFLDFSTHAYQRPSTHRPRLLLAGEEGQAQSTHLAPALLHSLERLPVHTLDLPTLFATSSKTPEEACSQVFREARRTAPSVLYMPHVCRWWDVVGDACRATFISLLADLEPATPTLLLATTEVPYLQAPAQVQELFSVGAGEVIVMQNPTDSERREFFQDLLLRQATKPPSTRRKAAQRMLEQLPKAPPPKPRELTPSEIARLREHEEATLREMRLFLRDVLNKLGRDRKFQIFAKPVEAEEVPDYYEIITNPMDMSTMMSKIDLCKYETVSDFLRDIDLICSNALEYNPADTLIGRAIRHRACALRDMAQATIEQELDRDFEKQCEEIKKARKNRGESPQKNIPDYYFTKPINRVVLKALRLDPTGLQIEPEASTPASSCQRGGARQSRRRGRAESAAVDESMAEEPSQDSSLLIPEVPDEPAPSPSPAPAVYEEIHGVRYQKVVRRERKKRAKLPQYKSVWCKPSKQRFHHVTYYIDPQGREFTHKELFEVEEKEEDKEVTSQDTAGATAAETADDEQTTPAETTRETCEDSQEDTIIAESGESKADTKDPDVEACADASKLSVVLKIDTNLNDLEAEKENHPSPRYRKRSLSGSASEVQGHHSPRSRSQGHSPRANSNISPRAAPEHSPRTRSKSPRGEGQRNLSPQQAPRSPRSRSPRASAGSISPRNKSPRTRSVDKPKSPRAACVVDKKVDSAADDKEVKAMVTESAPEVTQPVTDQGDCGVAMETSPAKCTSQSTPATADSTAAARDSPKKVENSPAKSREVKDASGTAGSGQDKQEEMETEETSVSTRVTRSRAHGHRHAERAADAPAPEDAPRVVVDVSRLHALLDKVVEKSRGYRVEACERLYSVLSQAVYHHRREYDKTQLVTELESSLHQFVTHH